jgi:steroid delta-isomerase
MSADRVRAAVAQYFAAIRAGDPDAWLATFAEDAVSHDPAAAPPMVGHAALREFFLGIAGAFTEVGLWEDQVFVSGSGAAVKWTGRGTGRNGRAVTFEGIDVFEINAEGRISRLYAYWDPAALMADLRA